MKPRIQKTKTIATLWLNRAASNSKFLSVLIFGAALMLVWAGIVEEFFSQYHEPVLPHAVKIAFGCIELVLLILYLNRCGKTADPAQNPGCVARDR